MEKKYKSNYGADGEITVAQYLVEFIMERQAKKDKTTLPWKFWNLPKWNVKFRMQIKYANLLLKEYTVGEVFAALKSKQGLKVYSLGSYKTMLVPLLNQMRSMQKPADKAEEQKPDETFIDNSGNDIMATNTDRKKTSWEELN